MLASLVQRVAGLVCLLALEARLLRPPSQRLRGLGPLCSPGGVLPGCPQDDHSSVFHQP